jgi:uncharacterized membrane protein YcaP (DUF421 family)
MVVLAMSAVLFVAFMEAMMLFDSWMQVARVLIVGTGAYVALLVLHRLSGKRTLSKLNAFDLVVSVSMGSTLANTLLASGTALIEGVTALGLLIALQFIVAWLSVRSRGFSRLIKSEPTLLLSDGQMLPAAMRKERILPEEVHQAARTAGLTDASKARSVILETDGTLSVIAASDNDGGQADGQ